jgi:hypothetical protein
VYFLKLLTHQTTANFNDPKLKKKSYMKPPTPGEKNMYLKPIALQGKIVLKHRWKPCVSKTCNLLTLPTKTRGFKTSFTESIGLISWKQFRF